MTTINKTTPMEDLTIGGNIYEAGNSKEFPAFCVFKLMCHFVDTLLITC